MESHYSLNIARVNSARAWDWRPSAPTYTASHFCRIDLGPDRDGAVMKARDIATRFPQGATPGDFILSLTYWDCVGRHIDFTAPGEGEGEGVATLGAAIRATGAPVVDVKMSAPGDFMGLPRLETDATPDAQEAWDSAVDSIMAELGVTLGAVAMPDLAHDATPATRDAIARHEVQHAIHGAGLGVMKSATLGKPGKGEGAPVSLGATMQGAVALANALFATPGARGKRKASRRT